MKRNSFVIITLLVASVVFITAFGSYDDATTTTPTNGGDTAILHAAFNEFDTNNVTITLNGSNIEIETNGRPTIHRHIGLVPMLEWEHQQQHKTIHYL